ncbi:hypothetical protein [Pseudomonas sp. OIL-1]|uniref:hypothetical protein n=1 Tax=Pseudomonas sp. OIL-1 TaxID=2706126 RepID=UPI0013A77A48|nr:hypothetical protein [Pseudomonas sp. OIL-1]QIB52613.1 hypothetical protein G3M63_17120 [Pseudomonas sp. OIL-1]
MLSKSFCGYGKQYAEVRDAPTTSGHVTRDHLKPWYGLSHAPNIQYADIFSPVEKLRFFFHRTEKTLEKHKLWLDLKVRHHTPRMQAYFATINALLVSFNRVPLPDGVELSEEDFTKLGDQLLPILGAVLDEEFNCLGLRSVDGWLDL